MILAMIVLWCTLECDVTEIKYPGSFIYYPTFYFWQDEYQFDDIPTYYLINDKLFEECEDCCE